MLVVIIDYHHKINKSQLSLAQCCLVEQSGTTTACHYHITLWAEVLCDKDSKIFERLCHLYAACDLRAILFFTGNLLKVSKELDTLRGCNNKKKVSPCRYKLQQLVMVAPLVSCCVQRGGVKLSSFSYQSAYR